MSAKDFEGITKFKLFILLVVISLLVLNVLGPLYVYDSYLTIYIYVQSIYMVKMFYYVVMTAFAACGILKVLKRVEKKEKPTFEDHRTINHAIVLPIYMEEDQILKNTLKFLACHERARENYLIFLAFE
jgi:hypothetical protein